jgi:hypothetical protein
MLATEELTEAQWQIADAIARQLVIEGTDVNELRKAISYLRDHQDESDAGKKFFDYLKTLSRHGNAIGHSKRTLGYCQSLDAVCSQFLESYQGNAPRMLHILSWAARLVQYYGKGVKQENTFTVGRELESTITAVKGNNVTYELLGKVKLTQKEHKKANEMSEGQKVRVEILQLRDDGLPKKVKLLL